MEAITFRKTLTIAALVPFVAAGLFVMGASGQEVIPLEIKFGLVAYWPFDEGSGSVAHDLSGLGNDATLSETSWVGGMCGYAVEFVDHGIGQSVPASFDDPISTAFTIEVWVSFYGASPYADYNILIDARYGYGNHGGFTFRSNRSGYLVLQVGDGTQFNIHYRPDTILCFTPPHCCNLRFRSGDHSVLP